MQVALAKDEFQTSHSRRERGFLRNSMFHHNTSAHICSNDALFRRGLRLATDRERYLHQVFAATAKRPRRGDSRGGKEACCWVVGYPNGRFRAPHRKEATIGLLGAVRLP